VARDQGVTFPLLSDPERRVIGDYGVADAGPEISMPAVFVVRRDGVISWRAVGESMRDLPTAATVLQAVTAARDEAGGPAAAP
jgi:peroxiredoxin